MFKKMALLLMIVNATCLAVGEPSDANKGRPELSDKIAKDCNLSKDEPAKADLNNAIVKMQVVPCLTCGCEGYKIGCNCICHHEAQKSDPKEQGQPKNGGEGYTPVVGGGCEI